jgi:hypothetical protein
LKGFQSRFTESRVVAYIGYVPSRFSARHPADGKERLLEVVFREGKLGSVEVRMFGTAVFPRLLMAALSRDIAQERRRDFFLFVGGFQNFTTLTIADMLLEERKYSLSLTLANQTLFQLDDYPSNGSTTG